MTSSHKILQMAALLSAVGSAQAMQPSGQRPTLGQFIGQLQENAALRARFSRDPRSVLEETGLDPGPYLLPDRLDEEDVERFLRNWAGARGPTAGSHPASAFANLPDDGSVGQAARSDEHLDRLASEATPPPPLPAPVYGPPAGLPNKPRDPIAPPPPTPQPNGSHGPGDSQHAQPPSPPALIYGPPAGFRPKP